MHVFLEKDELQKNKFLNQSTCLRKLVISETKKMSREAPPIMMGNHENAPSVDTNFSKKKIGSTGKAWFPS